MDAVRPIGARSRKTDMPIKLSFFDLYYIYRTQGTPIRRSLAWAWRYRNGKGLTPRTEEEDFYESVLRAGSSERARELIANAPPHLKAQLR